MRQRSAPGSVNEESEIEVDGYDALSMISDAPTTGPKLYQDEAVELDDVTATEFRTFLKLLFPM